MEEEYKSKNFDHLGIVSVVCEEMGPSGNGRSVDSF